MIYMPWLGKKKRKKYKTNMVHNKNAIHSKNEQEIKEPAEAIKYHVCWRRTKRSLE